MLTFLSLLLMATAALHGQEEIVAIKAGKILTVSSAPVTDGVILIENGKIAEVGTKDSNSRGRLHYRRERQRRHARAC